MAGTDCAIHSRTVAAGLKPAPTSVHEKIFKKGNGTSAVQAFLGVCVLILLSPHLLNAQEKKPDTFNIAYTSATPTRAPLWIAKEMGLFEKYGLDARLIYIRAGSPSISALVSGDVHMSSDPAAAAAIA